MLREMLGEWFPQVGACVARISVRETVGQFPAKHIHGEDVEWFLKLAQTRKVAFQNTACILFRGRPSGSFDELNRSRTKAGRRIFLRYGLAEWRIWRSIPEFLRGYRAKLIHFYQYFFDAARDRRQAGNLRAAIVALADAAYVFPFRLVATVLTPGPVKRAIKARAQHDRA